MHAAVPRARTSLEIWKRLPPQHALRRSSTPKETMGQKMPSITGQMSLNRMAALGRCWPIASSNTLSVPLRCTMGSSDRKL